MGTREKERGAKRRKMEKEASGIISLGDDLDFDDDLLDDLLKTGPGREPATSTSASVSISAPESNGSAINPLMTALADPANLTARREKVAEVAKNKKRSFKVMVEAEMPDGKQVVLEASPMPETKPA